MQLLLVLAVLLMLGGKNDGAHRPQLTHSDMLEVLKYVSDGNGEMDKIIKEVEQVSQIINTFAPLAASFAANDNNIEPDGASTSPHDVGLFLQPVANIADDSIYNAMSKAIA